MEWIRKRILWVAVGLVVLVVVGSVAAWQWSAKRLRGSGTAGNPGGAEVGGANGDSVTVQVIRPKRDYRVTLSVQACASVEPLFQAGLMAQVAGPVSDIHKDKGDRVRKDEVLVRIDVPALVDEVELKESLVARSRVEVSLARDQAEAKE